jgi:thiol peroxidase
MKITFGGNEVTLYGDTLKVGDSFPDFTLTDTKLADVTNDDIKGAKVVLTFPSVDTAPCSLELLTFNDRLEDFKSYKVFGVSMDLPFAIERFVKVNAGDNINMLSDHKYRIFGEKTGTYIEELALLARAAFVVDKNEKITYIEFVSEVGDEVDYDRVLVEAAKVF